MAGRNVMCCINANKYRILSSFKKITLISARRQCSSTPQDYDVVISGGGMVGTAMTAALAHDPMLADKSILLLEAGERKTFNKPPDIYSSRVCALSPATVDLLSSFGAWENICNMRYKEVKRMQVWESCSKSMITFNQEELMDNLAYIVENDIILNGIVKQVENIRDNVEIRYQTKVRRYDLAGTGPKQGAENHDHLAHIELENGDQLRTKLLIGADGFRSLLRETVGFHTVGWDYNQFGVVATLRLAEEVENNVAWQRFLPNGPIAMLPLSNEFSCLIWTTNPEDAKNLVQLPHESFVDAVNDAFWSDSDLDPVADYASQTLDNILTTVGLDGSSSQQLPPTVLGVEEGTRARFPLGLCHSSQYVKSRMALIGDAAHRVHPLAGQGVNLGFGDVACLRDQISKSVYNGQDIGALEPLLEYETLRQRHVIPTMATVDGLNRLYSNKFTPLVLLRSLGLQVTNALGPLKNRMISHATN